MRKSLFWILLLSCGLLFSLSAQEKGLGTGLIIGEPTGFSAKLWLDSQSAIDAALAYSLAEPEFNLRFHADYLLHFLNILPEVVEGMNGYAGLGAYVLVGQENFQLGLRVPCGLVWFFKKVPLDLFLEVAPGMQILMSTKFTIGGGLGLRWFFN